MPCLCGNSLSEAFPGSRKELLVTFQKQQIETELIVTEKLYSMVRTVPTQNMNNKLL